MGATKKRGEKLLSLEEFLPIYGQVKKEKDQGCYEDFLECLKLYDKNENGFMLLAELNHALLALGKWSPTTPSPEFVILIRDSKIQSIRWKFGRRTSWGSIQRLHGRRERRWRNPIWP